MGNNLGVTHIAGLTCYNERIDICQPAIDKLAKQHDYLGFTSR